MSNIILIGSMGAGKTTNGKWLAKQLGKKFIDLDHQIEQKSGATITQIFEFDGEPGFRIRESAALAEALSEENQVIATGGGAVLAKQNRELMKQRGIIIFLNIHRSALHFAFQHTKTAFSENLGLSEFR